MDRRARGFCRKEGGSFLQNREFCTGTGIRLPVPVPVPVGWSAHSSQMYDDV
jgi:hypothetical protein